MGIYSVWSSEKAFDSLDSDGDGMIRGEGVRPLGRIRPLCARCVVRKRAAP